MNYFSRTAPLSIHHTINGRRATVMKNYCIVLTVGLATIAGCGPAEEQKVEEAALKAKADSVLAASEARVDSLKRANMSYMDKLSPDERKARMEELKSRFVHKVDEFKDVSFYMHKQFGGKAMYLNRKAVTCYANSEGTTFLESNYFGDDWIFHTYLIFLIGDEKVSTDPKPSYSDDVQHHNAGGKVWESIMYKNDPILKKIAEALDADPDTEIKVRFTGGDYYADLTLSKKDKLALKDCYEIGYLLKSDTES